MTTSELLAQQFDLLYTVVGMNVEGMTADHADIEPAPGANSANWNLAHLIQVQNGVMGLIGEAPVWTHERLPEIGLPAYRSSADAFDWEEMTAAFMASHERCVERLRSMDAGAYEQEVPDPFGGTTSVASLLNLLANHQPYHAGQLGLLRRIAGLPGAVKGPGEQG